MTDIKLGIEIETNTHASEARMVQALRDAGLHADNGDRYSTAAPFWIVKYDGSLSRGWELVSPILSLAEVKDQLPLIGRAFRDLAAQGTPVRATRDCGLHVHLSGFFEDRPVDILRNLSRRWCNFEDTLDLFQPPSRRASANHYCRSNTTVYGSPWVPLAQRLDAMWDTTGRCLTADRLVDTVSPGRYFKLNMTSLHRHGTVEFRQHAGSCRPSKIWHWANFLHSFALTAREADRVWKRKFDTAESPQARFRKLVRGVPRSTVRYLSNRFEGFSGQSLAEV